MCQSVIWFRRRTFWAYFVNCDLINNNKTTVVKLGTCIVNVLSQGHVKYYIVNVLMVKRKFHHEGPKGEKRHNLSPSLTSAVDGGGWSAPRPGRFTPRKDNRYPLYRRLGGSHSRCIKILPPPGFDPRTVQPVACRYTNWAIPAHELNVIFQLDSKTTHFWTYVYMNVVLCLCVKNPWSCPSISDIFHILYRSLWYPTCFRSK